MIDLHAHLLPGVDDGPPDLEAALALARAMVADGVSTVAATSHVRARRPAAEPVELAERAAALDAELRSRGIPLAVHPGGEVDLVTALDLGDEELRAATLGGNGRDVLIETPYGPLPAILERALESLARRGFRVLLAHPERSPGFQAEPERLEALVEGGLLVQVTAASLGGGRRSAARELAWRALRAGWVHALASDSHAVSWRPPDLGSRTAQAARAAPELAAELAWLTNAAPAAVLAGEPLPPRPARPAPAPPAQTGRRGLLGRLRGRVLSSHGS